MEASAPFIFMASSQSCASHIFHGKSPLAPRVVFDLFIIFDADAMAES